MSSVPLLDLRRDAPRLGEALRETGFAILTHHGLPASAWNRAIAAAARAFALPDALKARYRGPDDGSQRGYLPLRTALPDGRPAFDRKECWHARRPGHRYANLFPAEVPELGPACLALIPALDRLAERLLDALDAHLGYAPGTLVARVRGGDSLFRINHYPDHGDDVRFHAHRDFDLFTLLLGASRPGLELETRDGRWLPLTPSPEAIVINAGDLLAVESAGRIPSTRHRVVTPAARDGGRLSMVYFVAPRPEVRLRDGRTAGEVIDGRLRDAGYLR
jgi:isopenicillin N synthase-like dioxygenase